MVRRIEYRKYFDDERHMVAGTVHVSDTLYTFLTERAPTQVQRIFNALFNDDRGGQWNGRRLALRDDGKPYLDFSALRVGEEPVISYLPHGKSQTYTDEGRWRREGRQTAKPARWLQMFLTKEAMQEFGITIEGDRENPDPGRRVSVVEQFTDKVKAFVKVDVRLEEVAGEAIRQSYLYTSYAAYSGHSGDDPPPTPGQDWTPAHDPDDDDGNEIGSLGNSCMRYRKTQKFLDFYVNNPDCAMLVGYNKHGRVVGRALLWRNVDAKFVGQRKHEKITFLDRVYVHKTHVTDLFTQYAREHGYYHKRYQTYETNANVVAPSGEDREASMTIHTHQPAHIPYYPYMDTFVFLAADWLTVRTERDPAHPYSMGSVGGGLEGYVDRTGQTNTHLDGWVPTPNVDTCSVCRQTGDGTNFINPATGRVGMSVLGIAGDAGTMCRNCLTNCFVYSAAEGGRWIPRAEARKYITARGRGADYAFITNPDLVRSKRHNGAFVLRTRAIHLGLEDDYIVPSQYDSSALRSLFDQVVVYSEYHGTTIMADDARYVYGVGHVHRDHEAEASARARAEAAAKQRAQKRYYADAEAALSDSVGISGGEVVPVPAYQIRGPRRLTRTGAQQIVTLGNTSAFTISFANGQIEVHEAPQQPGQEQVQQGQEPQEEGNNE